MSGPTDNNESQDVSGEAADQLGLFRPLKDTARAPAQPGEDMHRGWVKLWRKWRDHEMASDPNATLVFLHLLTEARREPKVNRRYGYTVQRGQTDLTLGQLSELTGLSVGQVRQALGRLEKYETIKRSTQNGKVPALTTIVNFDTYNPDTNGNNTQGSTSATDERHINDTSTTTPGEVEKGKKEEKTTLPAAKPPSEVTYPEDFQAFWQHYPKRKGKGAALRAWKKLSAADKDAAIDRAEWVAGCWEHWDPDEQRRQFIQDPATWLNARGWEDEDSAVEIMARGK